MAGKTVIVGVPTPDGKIWANVTTGPGQTFCVPMPAFEVDVESDDFDSNEIPRKRAKLTHLSAEEKLNRRKLRNRIAAQSARDRKKEQFEHMQVKLQELEAENESLRNENEKLRAILRSRHHIIVKEKKPMTIKPVATKSDTETQTTESGASASPALESAALISAPQQQGQAWAKQLVSSMLLTLVSTPSSTSSKGSSEQEQTDPHTLTPEQQIRFNNLNLRHAEKLRLGRILLDLAASHSRKKPLQEVET